MCCSRIRGSKGGLEAACFWPAGSAARRRLKLGPMELELMLHWPNVSTGECFITPALHPTRHDTDSGRCWGVTYHTLTHIHSHTTRRGFTRKEVVGADLFSREGRDERREVLEKEEVDYVDVWITGSGILFPSAIFFLDTCHANCAQTFWCFRKKLNGN